VYAALTQVRQYCCYCIRALNEFLNCSSSYALLCLGLKSALHVGALREANVAVATVLVPQKKKRVLKLQAVAKTPVFVTGVFNVQYSVLRLY